MLVRDHAYGSASSDAAALAIQMQQQMTAPVDISDPIALAERITPLVTSMATNPMQGANTIFDGWGLFLLGLEVLGKGIVPQTVWAKAGTGTVWNSMSTAQQAAAKQAISDYLASKNITGAAATVPGVWAGPMSMDLLQAVQRVGQAAMQNPTATREQLRAALHTGMAHGASEHARWSSGGQPANISGGQSDNTLYYLAAGAVLLGVLFLRKR
jgi:hypothetical protein